MSDIAAPIPETIRALIAEHLGVEPADCTDDALLDHLGADQLDRIEFAMTIEERHFIAFDGVEEAWNTVGDVIAATMERLP